jgi:hypothetical protein
VKIMRGRTPPGGWHYEVSPHPRLEAINEEELIKLIFEYRLRNNLPIGDIERDLDNYYCSRWPEACQKEQADWGIPQPEVTHVEPLLNRVTRWVSQLIRTQPRGGYELVSAEEAARRGSICAGCPKNQPWRVGCRGCSNSTASASAALRKMLSSRQHGDLHACEMGGWDNQTAVWMPKESLEEPAGLPERCWRRAI